MVEESDLANILEGWEKKRRDKCKSMDLSYVLLEKQNIFCFKPRVAFVDMVTEALEMRGKYGSINFSHVQL